mgnify:CR=1 FL=1
MKYIVFISLMASSIIGIRFTAEAQVSKSEKQIYTSGKYINRIPTEGKKTIEYSFKLLQLNNNTFGYEVFANGVLILRQDEYPGRGAGNGFQSEKDATIIAQVIISKLQRPVAPPVLSAQQVNQILLMKNSKKN